MKEMVQFRSPRKQELKQIAKEMGISLNALMIIIVDDYLKRMGK